MIVAIPLGIFQAVAATHFDYMATGAAFVVYATPVFFLGLLLMQLFSQRPGAVPPEAPQGDGVAPIFERVPRA